MKTVDRKLALLIEGLEEKVYDPFVRSSARLLQDLFDDNFFEFGASGHIYDKKDVLEVLPMQKEAKSTMHKFMVNEIAPQTLLATYKLEREDIDTAAKTWSLRSSIWQFCGDRWKIIFHQGTPRL